MEKGLRTGESWVENLKGKDGLLLEILSDLGRWRWRGRDVGEVGWRYVCQQGRKVEQEFKHWILSALTSGK